MGDKKGQGYGKYVFGAYIYVICAFLGAILFIILFIFAKRQIMRFALRSRRGPHFPIGHDAKKVKTTWLLLLLYFTFALLIAIYIFQSIKKEIERRLDCIQRIAYEPQLIWDDDSRYILKPDENLPPFYYRFKAVDDIKILGSFEKKRKIESDVE